LLSVIAASFIGVLMGLLGAGGGIVTVPVLVYFLGHDLKAAVLESHGIVGGIAVLTLLTNPPKLKGLTSLALWFGLPVVVGGYAGVSLAFQASQRFQVVLLLSLIFVAAMAMVSAPSGQRKEAKRHWLTLTGFLVGVVTSIIGAGGGFLMVPAMVRLGGLPITRAIPMSVIIIAVKSLISFVSGVAVASLYSVSVDWVTVALFTAFGGLGGKYGTTLGKSLSTTMVRRSFAGFLVILAFFIGIKEFL
jgi:uncharacterized protein